MADASPFGVPFKPTNKSARVRQKRKGRRGLAVTIDYQSGGVARRMRRAGAICGALAIMGAAITTGVADPTMQDRFANLPDWMAPEKYERLPGWLQRTNIELMVDWHLLLNEGDARFSAGIETVQPILQGSANTWNLFYQGRAAYEHDNERFTTNQGLGARYLVPGGSFLVGLSGWLDYGHFDEVEHWRWGLSGEAIGSHLTARANYYDAMSGWQQVSRTVTTTDTTETVNIVEERALDGFDLSLEGPLPYLPWARVSVGYFNWDRKTDDDLTGLQTGIRVNLAPSVQLSSSQWFSEDDVAVNARLNIFLGAPKELEFTALEHGITPEMFPARNVQDHMLDRVQRQHEILVERRTRSTTSDTVATSGGVSIGRSS